MKTTIFKTKIDRKHQQLDATNQAAGRLATQIATILRGKHKPDYSPQIDSGDFVVVINADKLKFTGNKIEQKKYYHYSGYPGGLKETQMKKVFKVNPEEIIKKTVWNMLPKNKLRQHMIKRLSFKNQ